MKAKVTLMIDNMEKTMGKARYDLFHRSKVTEELKYVSGGLDVYLSPKVDLFCLENLDLSEIKSFSCKNPNTLLILDHCVLAQKLNFKFGHIEIISPTWKTDTNIVRANKVIDMEIDRKNQEESEVQWKFQGENFSYLNGANTDGFYINAQNILLKNVVNDFRESFLNGDTLTLERSHLSNCETRTFQLNEIIMDKKSSINGNDSIVSSDAIILGDTTYDCATCGAITIGDEHGDRLEANRKLISDLKTIAQEVTEEFEMSQNRIFQDLEEKAALEKRSYQEKIQRIDEKLQRDKESTQKTLQKRLVGNVVFCKTSKES